MTLQSVAPLRFKGIKSDWLSTLPDSGTEMLTISSTGVVSRQAIPSASFGALTGLPSDNTALQSALEAKSNVGHSHIISDTTGLQSALDSKANSSSLANYLPLAGGTLTGGLSGTSLTLSGIATINGGNQNSAGIQLGGSTVFGPCGLSNGWTFVQASAAQMRFSGGGIVIQSGKTFAWGNSFTDTGTTQLWEDASHVVAQRNGANAQTWRLYNAFTDTGNYIRQTQSFATFSSTVHAQWLAEGLGTGAVNIPMVISPRGTGAFILGPMPDGTATGGNARGVGAVDLQLLKNTATQVASGSYSFIGGGQRNTVSSQNGAAFGFGCTVSGGNEGNLAGGYESTASGSQSSFAWGNRCTASGAESSWVIGYESSSTAKASIAMGRNARSDRSYQYSHAAGSFSTTGDAQYTRFVLKNRTTDATPTVLVGGVLPSFTTRLSINTGEVLGFVANITGSKSDGTAIAHYVRKGLIKRIGTTTTLVYVETVGTDYEDNAATDVSIAADDANDALQISVTGIAGETWRWVATVEAADLGFGT